MKGKGQGHVVIRALGRNESPPMLLLIGHAIETARQQGYKTIEIGTGNSSIGQLALFRNSAFASRGSIETSSCGATGSPSGRTASSAGT